MSRIRVGRRKRRQVRVGAPDRALTANAAWQRSPELGGRLGVIEALDTAIGSVKLSRKSSSGTRVSGPGNC